MFLKLLSEDLIHNGFLYQDGLNVDTLPFNPQGSCQPGGLYYTTREHLPLYYRFTWRLVADVTIPPDARVYTEPCGTKWKADRIVLSNIRPLSQLFETLSEKILLDFVSRDGLLLQHIEKQTEDMCSVAINSNFYAFEYVKDQTDALCHQVLDRSPTMLFFIRNQTEDMCLHAVSKDGWAIQYVRDQTEWVCIAAVQNVGLAIKYVINQTPTVRAAALASRTYFRGD